MTLAFFMALGGLALNGLSDVFLKRSADQSDPFRTNLLRTLACLIPVVILIIAQKSPVTSSGLLFWTLSVSSGLLMALAVHFSILALRGQAAGLQLPIIRMAFVVTLVIEIGVESRIPSTEEVLAICLAAVGIFLISGSVKASHQ